MVGADAGAKRGNLRLDGQPAAADAALIDKLAELDVIDQADADRIKQHMQEGLAEIKESGDFPMGHQRSKAPRKENQGEQG